MYSYEKPMEILLILKLERNKVTGTKKVVKSLLEHCASKLLRGSLQIKTRSNIIYLKWQQFHYYMNTLSL